jgi:flagellin
MRINCNVSSLNIYRRYSKSLEGQNSALERISSGLKIRAAKDDPNGLGKSEIMRMQIRGLQVAQKNVQDASGAAQTSEGALNTVTDMLNRMKELTMQCGGVENADDKAVIQTEIDELKKGIQTTINNTDINGVKTLAYGSDEKVRVTNGVNEFEAVKFPMYNLKVNGDTSITSPTIENGGKGLLDGLKSASDANFTTDDLGKNLSIIGEAVNNVVTIRSEYGTLQNIFETSYDISSAMEIDIQSAESNIRDADVAEEAMEYSKFGILTQASTALLAQSNKLPQDVLSVLASVKAK